MSALNFRLESFEGPLDLLLHLIQKNKVDIYHIPLAEIIRQYLEYIELMQELNLNIAGEFLLMASTLMNIKSRLLLPIISEDEDQDVEMTLQDLISHLLEYQKFKELALVLEEKATLQHYNYPPATEKELLFTETPMQIEVSLYDLLKKMQEILDQAKEKSPQQEVQRPQITIEDKIGFILSKIPTNEPIQFTTLFSPEDPPIHIVVTFLAILELLRQRKLTVYQVKSFAPIWVRKS